MNQLSLSAAHEPFSIGEPVVDGPEAAVFSGRGVSIGITLNGYPEPCTVVTRNGEALCLRLSRNVRHVINLAEATALRDVLTDLIENYPGGNS